MNGMEKSDLVTLAKTTAVKYNLIGALVCGICDQESAWDPLALRLEEGFYVKYIRTKLESGEVTASEAALRCCSIGLMQVLLEVTRELGYTGTFDALASDVATQIDLGCRKFAKCVAEKKDDMVGALLEYNGGGDPFYAKKVISKSSLYT